MSSGMEYKVMASSVYAKHMDAVGLNPDLTLKDPIEKEVTLSVMVPDPNDPRLFVSEERKTTTLVPRPTGADLASVLGNAFADALQIEAAKTTLSVQCTGEGDYAGIRNAFTGGSDTEFADAICDYWSEFGTVPGTAITPPGTGIGGGSYVVDSVTNDAESFRQWLRDAIENFVNDPDDDPFDEWSREIIEFAEKITWTVTEENVMEGKTATYTYQLSPA